MRSIRRGKGRESNRNKNIETWNNLAYFWSHKQFSMVGTEEAWPVTLERPMRTGSWRALKISVYLPTFRGDLPQMLYDITHIWSLTFVESCPVCAEALCQVTTICHLLCMANWWQLWGEMMCAEAETKCFCCHIIFDSLTTTCSPLQLIFTQVDFALTLSSKPIELKGTCG